MAKQSILGRISQLMRANIHALLDQARTQILQAFLWPARAALVEAITRGLAHHPISQPTP